VVGFYVSEDCKLGLGEESAFLATVQEADLGLPAVI